MFQNLRNLRELYLPSNKLKEIPDNIFEDLTSLEKLGLGKRVLTLIWTLNLILNSTNVVFCRRKPNQGFIQRFFQRFATSHRPELNEIRNWRDFSDGVQGSSFLARTVDGYENLWCKAALTSIGILASTGFNSVKSISSQWFRGLKNLKALIINSNQIETLPDDAFDDLTSLENFALRMKKFKFTFDTLMTLLIQPSTTLSRFRMEVLRTWGVWSGCICTRTRSVTLATTHLTILNR